MRHQTIFVQLVILYKVLKGKIPCQAVYNDMPVDVISAELTLLEKLEQILIAQRIVFEKNCCNAERTTEKSIRSNL